MKTKIGYDDIFQCTSNGVIVTDEAGKIVLVNRQSERILDLDTGRDTGKPILETLPLIGKKRS